MTTLYLSVFLLLGIVVIKLLWIITDKTPLLKASKHELIKSNAIELSILILQAVAAVFYPLPSTKFDMVFIIIGLLLYVFGIIFAIWGRLSLSDTWGHPGKQVKHFQKKLITQKAFAISRNPIYVGFLCLFFGYAIAIRSVLIILRLPLIIYFYQSVVTEEYLLAKQFGKKYTEYKKRVPRFLFI